MKKFSIILESNSEERRLLFNKISSLKSWLYKSNGLGLMGTIDTIFKENGWETKLSLKEVANFNKGLDLLRETSMDQNWILKSKTALEDFGNVQLCSLISTYLKDLIWNLLMKKERRKLPTCFIEHSLDHTKDFWGYL